MKERSLQGLSKRAATILRYIDGEDVHKEENRVKYERHTQMEMKDQFQE